MEPDYLIDLIQIGVIAGNFFMGVCSLLMTDHCRQAGRQCPWAFFVCLFFVFIFEVWQNNPPLNL